MKGNQSDFFGIKKKRKNENARNRQNLTKRLNARIIDYVPEHVTSYAAIRWLMCSSDFTHAMQFLKGFTKRKGDIETKSVVRS